MLSNPKPGQLCRIRYRAGVREAMPWHDQVGVVVIASRARKCRNHGVRIGGVLVCVPSGNLNREKGLEGSD